MSSWIPSFGRASADPTAGMTPQQRIEYAQAEAQRLQAEVQREAQRMEAENYGKELDIQKVTAEAIKAQSIANQEQSLSNKEQSTTLKAFAERRKERARSLGIGRSASAADVFSDFVHSPSADRRAKTAVKQGRRPATTGPATPRVLNLADATEEAPDDATEEGQGEDEEQVTVPNTPRAQVRRWQVAVGVTPTPRPKPVGVTPTPRVRPTVRRSISNSVNFRGSKGSDDPENPEAFATCLQRMGLQRLGNLSSKVFADQVNCVRLHELLGAPLNENNPRLLPFIELCMDKKAFGTGSAGLKKNQLIVIMQYLGGREHSYTSSSWNKDDLNVKINDWYETKNPTPQEAPFSPSKQSKRIKLHWARKINETTDEWKTKRDKAGEPCPSSVKFAEYEGSADNMLRQAYLVGLFDEEHVNTFNPARLTEFRQFVLVDALDVLAKQLDCVFHGSSLSQKTESARKHAIALIKEDRETLENLDQKPTPYPTATKPFPETKYGMAQRIKQDLAKWLKQCIDKHENYPSFIQHPRYVDKAENLFKQAIRVGLFDEDHMQKFGKTAPYEEFVDVEDLDVLAKQMGTVFHGGSSKQKTQSARDYARRMGWDTIPRVMSMGDSNDEGQDADTEEVRGEQDSTNQENQDRIEEDKGEEEDEDGGASRHPFDTSDRKSKAVVVKSVTFDPESDRASFLIALKKKSSKEVIEEVNRTGLYELLGSNVSENNPLLFVFVELCVEKDAFGIGSAGIKKDKLIAIQNYIEGGTASYATKKDLNHKIVAWYNKKKTPTGEGPPTKFSAASDIKKKVLEWKPHEDLTHKRDADELFQKAFLAGLFDEEHVKKIKDVKSGRKADFSEFVLVEELNVLAKQMGAIFNGSGLIEKSKSVRDYAHSLGLEN